ncbi:MAG TPA: family 43 glycosylhydrolase, partial [Polyangiaceae bacterium]|nr:family 43 glycosylhydrolase [Polyangiaceae bacterium]
YVPINQRGGAMTIGVAVADSPTGPYEDAIGGPLVSDPIEMENWGFSDAGQTPYTIDPAVFVDDDGQAYLYYGGFWRLVGGRLGDDMISLEGELAELRINGTPGDGGYWEAPYLIKRDGTYYLIYAAGQNPATIDYATSSSPLGPFSYRGRILGQLPNVAGQDAATNHAGVAEFLGDWYLVYHVSDGPNGGGTYRREVAIERFAFAGDGSIPTVTPSDGIAF